MNSVLTHILGLEMVAAASFSAMATVVLLCGGWPGTMDPRPRPTRLQRCAAATTALSAILLVWEVIIYGFVPDFDPRWKLWFLWLGYASLVPIAFGGVLIRQQRIRAKQWWLTLPPFAVYLVLILVFGKEHTREVAIAGELLYAYQVIVYCFVCALLVRWDRRMKDEFSDISHKQSVWYRHTTLPILFMFLLWYPASYYPLIWTVYFPVLIPLLMVLTSRTLKQEEFDWKGADITLKDLLKDPMESGEIANSDSEEKKAEDPAGEVPAWVERLENLMTEAQVWRRTGLTRDELAMEVGVNRTYLSRYINSTTGGTFYDYVNDFRLREACRLLVSGDESIAYVANRCGFTSSTTFNRLFRERYGCTPTDYRKQKNA